MIDLYLAKALAPEGMKKYQWEHELGKKLLFTGLFREYGMDFSEEEPPVIEKGPRGKPYLKDYPHIHFNISHTEGLVACGFSDKELGVDVERIQSYNERVLRKVMSETESIVMRKLPPAKRAEYFFRIWTLKESYGKAVGTGIVMPLSDISFESVETGVPHCSREGVTFFQQILDGEFILSLCQTGCEKIRVKLNFIF
ncbi:4'-phosphopantetheinyl transferase superfamily protein [Clostridium sp. HBUAS56010]|uniref:4'-phosphopantetheinyl transferase family protein n=1 Tax=Clostridium sp. HBUAS56010 TaxID=2571127 RepID=UPI001177D075|nr:4'-phosphopantetheinyl transferase superfamily protein [Clostridium sp. HBUAS56010]